MKANQLTGSSKAISNEKPLINTRNLLLSICLVFLLTQLLGVFIGFQIVRNASQYTELSEASLDNIVILLPVGIAIAVLFTLILIKYKFDFVLVSWLYLALLIADYIAIQLLLTFTSNFMTLASSIINYLAIAIVASLLILRKNGNVYAHNISEILAYCGISALFLQDINLDIAVVLLLGFSIYDIIAVFRTKHMQKIAIWTLNRNDFSGIVLRSSKSATKFDEKDFEHSQKNQDNMKKKSANQVILGGGDFILPLIFNLAVLKFLFEKVALANNNLYFGLIFIPIIFQSIALYLHLSSSEKGKFYPMMPLLSVASVLGLAVVLLL